MSDPNLVAAMMADTLIHEAVATSPARERVVSVKVAQHALWHLGDSWGTEPGDFDKSLFRLIDKADTDNRARLLKVFPEHVIALRDGRKTTPFDGIAWLRSCALTAEVTL
jgi:hypothetical protein